MSSNFNSIAGVFPNEILYLPSPTASIGFSGDTCDISIKTRFAVDSFLKYTLNDPLIGAIMETESSFFIHSVSKSNALGVFQMKPFIASELGILNPFNPYKGLMIEQKLEDYKRDLGSIENALGAYHIGYYGMKNIIDSGKNPMNDDRVKSYVKKIQSFQRLYKQGDEISFRDYLWVDLSFSLSEKNQFDFNLVIPELYWGSIALGLKYDADFDFCLYQELSFFWFMSFFLGYDDGAIAGISFKSNDWFNRLTLRYDFSKEDLFWIFENFSGFVNFGLSFSKDSISFSPGFNFNDSYLIEFPIRYENFVLIPAIHCSVKF